MLNSNFYENSLPDGFSVLEVVPPSAEHAARKLFVPLRRTDLHGEVAGPLAAFRLKQEFSFSSQEFPHVIEALYRFPLPGDAAVLGVSVTFGESQIQAVLRGREEAVQEYNEARAEGRQAALLTRESPDVFTLHIAGLQPDQPAKIETRYTQLARPEGTGFSLRVPLTTAPRYVREDEVQAGSPHAQGQPLALLRDPGHRFTLDLRWRGACKISSPTHELNIQSTGPTTRVQLQAGEVIPNKDLVLNWEPEQQPARPVLTAWQGHDADHTYFLAQISPPSRFEPGSGASRESILLVDHSGSMHGAKWDTSDWAAAQFLSSLTSRDRFGLAVFHNDTHWITKPPVEASEERTSAAITQLKSMQDSGGTNLGVALEQALRQSATLPESSRHILILTDAQVSDAGRILRLLEPDVNTNNYRVSILCIDSSPNAQLALQLAERGGGIAKFLTSSASEGDLTTAVEEVLQDWAEPVIANVRLEVNALRVEGTGRVSTQSSHPGWRALDVGDLPCGRSVWILGRIPRGTTALNSLKLRAVDGRDRSFAEVHPQEIGSELTPALKALFGARRILELEYLAHSYRLPAGLTQQLKQLGYLPANLMQRLEQMGFPTAPGTVYEENSAQQAREAAREAARALLQEEALHFGLVSAETAFVAVRQEKGRPVQTTALVPSALSEGWAEAEVDVELLGSIKPVQGLSAPSPVLTGVANVKARRLPGNSGTLALADAGPTKKNRVTLFSGTPNPADGSQVLFDSQAPDSKDATRELAAFGRLSGIEFNRPTVPDANFTVNIFVDDMTLPKAKLKLSQLLRQGGIRPLNVRYNRTSHIRVVLEANGGVWPDSQTLQVVLICDF